MFTCAYMEQKPESTWQLRARERLSTPKALQQDKMRLSAPYCLSVAEIATSCDRNLLFPYKEHSTDKRGELVMAPLDLWRF